MKSLIKTLVITLLLLMLCITAGALAESSADDNVNNDPMVTLTEYEYSEQKKSYVVKSISEPMPFSRAWRDAMDYSKRPLKDIAKIMWKKITLLEDLHLNNELAYGGAIVPIWKSSWYAVHIDMNGYNIICHGCRAFNVKRFGLLVLSNSRLLYESKVLNGDPGGHKSGGAIMCEGNMIGINVTFENCKSTTSMAEHGGGAIAVHQLYLGTKEVAAAHAILAGCSFDKCHADHDGGAIQNAHINTISVEGEADGDIDDVFSEDEPIDWEGESDQILTTFLNRVEDISESEATQNNIFETIRQILRFLIEIKDKYPQSYVLLSRFTDCTARSGGAVEVSINTKSVMQGCVFDNCRAYNGGAIEEYYKSKMTLKSCTIQNCKADNEGGGIRIYCSAPKASPEATLIDTVITNNKAKTGGGVFLDTSIRPKYNAHLAVGGDTIIDSNNNWNLYIPKKPNLISILPEGLGDNALISFHVESKLKTGEVLARCQNVQAGERALKHMEFECYGWRNLYGRWNDGLKCYDICMGGRKNALYTITVIDGTLNDGSTTLVVNDGSDVTLHADDKKGYTFSHWEVTAGDFAFEDKQDKEEEDLTITMPSNDVVFTAVFVKDTPRTGDNTPIALLLTLSLCSAAALILLVARKRRS